LRETRINRRRCSPCKRKPAGPSSAANASFNSFPVHPVLPLLLPTSPQIYSLPVFGQLPWCKNICRHCVHEAEATFAAAPLLLLCSKPSGWESICSQNTILLFSTQSLNSVFCNTLRLLLLKSWFKLNVDFQKGENTSTATRRSPDSSSELLPELFSELASA